MCEYELHYSIQSNPIQFNSIQFNKVQFNSNSIYYKSKSNSISMISQLWLLDDEKCDDVNNDVKYDVQNDVNMILCHFKVSKSSHFTSLHLTSFQQFKFTPISIYIYIYIFFLSNKYPTINELIPFTHHPFNNTLSHSLSCSHDP